MPIDLHRPVCDLLGCEHPVVLAGMGGVARSELVIAVTQAGGFGFLGMVREQPSLIRAEVQRIRDRTSRDFGVNLIPAATDPALLDAQIAACIEVRVPVVGFFWDLSTAIVGRLLEAGIIVVCQIGSPDEAAAAQDAGAHALIAQGCEAGGHVRGKKTLQALLPEVVAQTHIPVLAAGGIMDGAGLAAVLARGAQGAVIGTAFLATHESFAHAYHEQRIVEARPGDTVLTDFFHLNWPAGARVRVLANSVTRGERGNPFSGERTIIGEEDGRAIYLFSTDSPLRSTTGDFEAMALYAGEAAGQVKAITTAGERLHAIVAEAAAILGARTPTRLEPPATEPSSPVCWAGEADDPYMGYASRDELAAFLNGLLEAERAGARVALHTSREVEAPSLKTLLAAIQSEEARWCGVLAKAVHALKVEPSQRTGAFYEEAMAIADLSQRLAFLNRRQGWVVRKLREMLPKIRDDGIHRDLTEMLAAHERNIALVGRHVSKRRPPR